MEETSPYLVALYGRMSGKVQADMKTIETQIKIMERWCRENGHPITARYLDRKRCQNETPMHLRPEGGRLLEDCSKGIFNAVLVAFGDRISRDRRVADPVMDVFRKYGIRYFSATEGSDLETDEGILVYDIHMAVGGFEKRKIDRRTSEGKDTWLREKYQDAAGNWYHYWMGGRTPYGWKSVEVNRRRGLIINEELIPGHDVSYAEVRRLLYRWVTVEHLSLRRMADRLNARGIPTHSYLPEERGFVRAENRFSRNQWCEASVRHMLHSPLPKGVHVWGINRKNGEDPVVRAIPPLVDETTWTLAQACLQNNMTVSKRNCRMQYLLRGKIRCGWCESAYCGKPQFGGSKQKEGLWFYVCQGYNDPKRHLHPRGIQSCGSRRLTNAVEATVWKDIVSFVNQPDVCIERIRQQIHGRHDIAAQIRQQTRVLQATKERVETAIRNTLQAWDDGDLSQKLMASRIKEKEAEIVTLDAEIATLEQQRLAHETAEAQLDHTRDFLLHLGKEVETAGDWPWEMKRELVERMVDQIWVMPPETAGEEPRLHILYIFDGPLVAERTRAVAGSSILAATHNGTGISTLLVRHPLETAA